MAAKDDVLIESNDPLANPRVADAVARYQAELEQGVRPQRSDYLLEYADIADVLDGCLQALDFVGGPMGQFKHVTNMSHGAEVLENGSLVGDFRIVREIGRGGMGVVYEAMQISLGRRVALKTLPRNSIPDERSLKRFQHEAQAAASVQHPHIVPVYFIGETEQRHYFAMQFIDGPTLTQVLRAMRAAPPSTDATGYYEKENRFPETASTVELGAETFDVATESSFRRIAGWLRQAALALQHAHEVGIIHRDIKPGNLLLELPDHIWVADFGLAKLPGSDLTQSEDVIGTIRYMSPEQASGHAVALDGRSDIYSLGATAYELLTLQPIFTAEDRRDLLRQVINEEPPPLHRWNAKIPTDLATIVQKAIAKEPAERYPTAGGLADDLQRFIEDRPIMAKPATRLQRVRKWMHRNRVLVGISTGAMLLVLLTTSGILLASNFAIDEKRREKEAALERESIALTKEREARNDVERLLLEEQRARTAERRTSYLHSFALAQRERLTGKMATARVLLNEAPEECRSWEWNYLNRLTSASFMQVTAQQLEKKPALGLNFTPDGVLFVPISGSFFWWSVPECKRIGGVAMKQTPVVGQMHLSPDGRLVLTIPPASARKTVTPEKLTVWDKQTGEPLATIDTRSNQFILAVFSADSQKVVVAEGEQMIRVWDARTGKIVHTLSGHTGKVRGLARAQRSSRLASFAEDSSIRLWDLDSGKLVRTISDAAIWSTTNTTLDGKRLDLSPDGQMVALGLTNGNVKIWEVASGRVSTSFAAHPHAVERIRYSPDGRFVASVGESDDRIKIWEIATERLTHQFLCLSAGELQFHPSGRVLACLHARNSVELFDLTNSAEARHVGWTYPTDRRFTTVRGLNQVAFAPDGQRLVVQVNGQVQVWNLADGQRTFVQSESRTGNEVALINHVAFVAGGEAILVCRNKVTDKMTFAPPTTTSWSIPTALQRHPFSVLPHQPTAKATPLLTLAPALFSQQVDTDEAGRLLAVIDGTTAAAIHLHDSATGARVKTFQEPEQIYLRLTLSADGKRLATVTKNRELVVWDVNSEQVLRRHSYQTADLKLSLTALKLDRAGAHLAVALGNGTVNVFHCNDGREEMSYATTRGSVKCLSFSHDGQRLALGLDGANEAASGVRLVDVASGRELLTLPMNAGATHQVAFSPDGKTLAAVDASGRVSLFESHGRTTPEKLAWWRNRSLDWHREQLYQSMVTGQYAACLEHIERALELAPKDAELLTLRTVTRNRLLFSQRFDPETAKEKEKTLTLKSGLDAYRLAAQYLEDSDRAGYQRVCTRMLTQIKPGASSFEVSLVFRLCTLSTAGTHDYQALLDGCNALFSNSKNPFLGHYLRGMILYRKGDYEAAQKELREATRYDVETNSQALNSLFLAMCEQRLGHSKPAKAALDKADDWYRNKLNQFATKSANVEYQVAIPFPLLRKEAADLVGEN